MGEKGGFREKLLYECPAVVEKLEERETLVAREKVKVA